MLPSPETQVTLNGETHEYDSRYLPQELVDHIIDHLYDDPYSLRQCALTCRAWLTTSRLHLFAKISFKPRISATPPQDRCRRLIRLIASAPYLTSYIRELEICEGASSPNLHHKDTSRSTTWIGKEATLPSLLKTLTHLRRLDISGVGAETINWESLPSTVQEAISFLLSRSTLTYVRLHAWSFPSVSALAGVLSQCRGLTALALSSTTVYDEDGLDFEVDAFPPPPYLQVAPEPDLSCIETGQEPARLEVLTLDFVQFSYLGYWLLRPQNFALDVTCLRELRVAHFPDPVIIEQLLLAIGGSLEHLHLKPGSWDVHPFDLCRNPALRSIRLTLEEPHTAMPWVMHLFSTISARNTLEHIGLDFYVDPKKLEGWAALDALLVRSDLSNLKHIDIGLFASQNNIEFTKVRDELGALHARGSLRLYQLGIKSQRSGRQLTPRISRYES